VATLNEHDAPLGDGTDHTHRKKHVSAHGVHRRRSAPHSRVAYAVGLAAVCTLVSVDLLASEPAATAAPREQSVVTVADALGIDGSSAETPTAQDRDLLEQLAASRAERDSEQAAAAASQEKAEKAAEKARADAKARAAAKAREKAAAEAKAKAEEKARAAAEAAKKAEQAAAAGATATRSAPASTAASVVARISNTAGPVRSQAQAAANAVVSNVSGAAGITIGGTRASAADPGGHPSGLALDYMVGSNTALGNAIVEYHIANWNALGVDYIIWRQRMLSSPGGSWSGMSDRGSATANHMDHPHVNYR
jgi:hypothetical protein